MIYYLIQDPFTGFYWSRYRSWVSVTESENIAKYADLHQVKSVFKAICSWHAPSADWNLRTTDGIRNIQPSQTFRPFALATPKLLASRLRIIQVTVNDEGVVLKQEVVKSRLKRQRYSFTQIGKEFSVKDKSIQFIVNSTNNHLFHRRRYGPSMGDQVDLKGSYQGKDYVLSLGLGKGFSFDKGYGYSIVNRKEHDFAYFGVSRSKTSSNIHNPSLFEITTKIQVNLQTYEEIELKLIKEESHSDKSTEDCDASEQT